MAKPEVTTKAADERFFEIVTEASHIEGLMTAADLAIVQLERPGRDTNEARHLNSLLALIRSTEMRLSAIKELANG